MTTKEIKVGDRVRHKTLSEQTGTVVAVDSFFYFEVEWDNPNVLPHKGWNESLELLESASSISYKETPRKALLREAERLVTQDRNNQYGPPTQDFDNVAAVLNILGFCRRDAGGDIRSVESHDFALVMLVLKLVRIGWNPTNRDSWVDTAGYAACGWECVENG